MFEGTVLRVSKCFRRWHTDRLQVARELERVSRILKANSKATNLSLIMGVVSQSHVQNQTMQPPCIPTLHDVVYTINTILVSKQKLKQL